MDAGVNAVGFVFARSPRKVGYSIAVRLAEAIPSTITIVGVFQNPTAAEIVRAVERVGINAVQVHGKIPENLALPEQVTILRAFRTTGAEILDDLDRHWASSGQASVLLDSQTGPGSGTRSDWDVAFAAARRGPIWLAGGLNPECVAEAVRAVRPFGVDVSSGVEKGPGKKNSNLIKRFVEEVRGALD